MKTDEKIRLYPDQFLSLSELRLLLKPNRRDVLDAILRFKEQDNRKSYATHDQIHEVTGVSYRTISRCISEFIKAGLLEQWQIPDGSWCRCLILPVADRVFEFYRGPRNNKSRSKNSVQRTVESPISDSVSESEQPVEAIKPKTQRITGTVEVRPIPANDESLDPAVAALVDQLRRNKKMRKNNERSVTVEFLTAVGAASFQVDYEDENFWINKDKLFETLRERRANSMDGFCKQVEEFSKIPKEFWCPRITLRASDKIMSVIDSLLKEYPHGRTWLTKQIYRQRDSDYDPSIKPMESEIRLWLVQVMMKNRTRSLDDIIEKAVSMDAEIEAQQG